MVGPIALSLLTFGLGVDAPTYSKDVAPILQAKCQECHRPGQVGPFVLTDYATARRRSTAIAEVLKDGTMPPWGASPEHGKFANDRSLSPEQKAILLAWIDAGSPEGDPKDLPEPREFPKDWQIGTPDAVFTMPRAFDVKAEGIVKYQYFVIPTNLSEDKWVQAYEIRPGSRAVVHHVLVFVANGNGPLRELGADGGAGGGQFAGYVPGDEATVFPDGMGKKLPAGSRLVLQVHYTPIGKPLSDRTSIAVKYATKPVTQGVRTKGIFQRRLNIPAGAANHPAEASWTLPVDATVLSLWPHMHVRGKSFQFTAVEPGGTPETLLDVPKYDFNWQSSYTLAEPRKLPKGTRLDCLAHYDNSAGNPHNPDPKQTVHWGDQTDEEMLIGYLDYVADGEAPVAADRPAAPAAAGPAADALAKLVGGRVMAILGDAALSNDEKADKILDLYDKDKSGAIDPAEVGNAKTFERLDHDADGKIGRADVLRLAEMTGAFLGTSKAEDSPRGNAIDAMRKFFQQKKGEGQP